GMDHPIIVHRPDLPDLPVLPNLNLEVLPPYALPVAAGVANYDLRYWMHVIAPPALPDNMQWLRDQQQQQQYHEALMREELRKQMRTLQQQQQQHEMQQMQLQALQQAMQRHADHQAALQLDVHHQPPVQALVQPDNIAVVAHDWPNHQQQQPPVHPVLINRHEYEDLVRRMRQQGGVNAQQQPAQPLPPQQPIAAHNWHDFVDPVFARQFLNVAHRIDRQAPEEPAAAAPNDEPGALDAQVADVQDVMDRLGRELEAQGLQMRIVDAEDLSDDEGDDEEEVDEEALAAEGNAQVQMAAAAKSARIAALIEENEKPDNLAKRYTRECPICINPNPHRRVVMTKCGHNSCEPCALYLANAHGRLKCPKCREITRYVRVFEELEDTPPPQLPPPAPQVPETSGQSVASTVILQGPMTRKRKRDQEAAAAAL
ncbi:hypothetical protein PMAYCL1PPCAC_25146, partial [Pristionchus mayeri]